jgi:YD repeat-containing protein
MGASVGTIDRAGSRTTIVYNSAEQKLAEISQLGFATPYACDPSSRLQSIQNPRGYMSTTIYNALVVGGTSLEITHDFGTSPPTYSRIFPGEGSSR